jgi:hypothetical protein
VALIELPDVLVKVPEAVAGANPSKKALMNTPLAPCVVPAAKIVVVPVGAVGVSALPLAAAYRTTMAPLATPGVTEGAVREVLAVLFATVLEARMGLVLSTPRKAEIAPATRLEPVTVHVYTVEPATSAEVAMRYHSENPTLLLLVMLLARKVQPVAPPPPVPGLLRLRTA